MTNFCHSPTPGFKDQRDALGIGNMVGANSQVANQGIVPLVVGAGPRTIEYALESVGGPWVAPVRSTGRTAFSQWLKRTGYTFTLWVTVVRYIV